MQLQLHQAQQNMQSLADSVGSAGSALQQLQTESTHDHAVRSLQDQLGAAKVGNWLACR